MKKILLTMVLSVGLLQASETNKGWGILSYAKNFGNSVVNDVNRLALKAKENPLRTAAVAASTGFIGYQYAVNGDSKLFSGTTCLVTVAYLGNKVWEFPEVLSAAPVAGYCLHKYGGLSQDGSLLVAVLASLGYMGIRRYQIDTEEVARALKRKE